jgi:hypothetical protein
VHNSSSEFSSRALASRPRFLLEVELTRTLARLWAADADRKSTDVKQTGL